MNQRISSLLSILVLLLGSAALAQTTRPVPEAERMVIISIDGCRPDVLLRANCPSVRSLMAGGSFTLWARTTAVSITLPSHVSMLTGVPPQKHGIMWNDDLPLAKPVYPKFPTIFELAHKAGYTTSLVSGKGKFKLFANANAGMIDWPLVTDSKNDEQVAGDSVKIIREHQPQVMFIHFPAVDVIGHGIGWGTDEQVKELDVIDAGIGAILAALDETHVRERTVVLLTADHGGAGRGHGSDDPRSRHIPWIINGPGIRKNYDLTRQQMLEVHTEDTFGTACYLLGLKPKPDTDGQPIREILVDRELLSGN